MRPVLWAADHPRRARTYARTQGIAVLRDEGHASLEWKAGIVGQRTHLTEGFGQLQGGLASAWCSHRAARRSGRGRWGGAPPSRLPKPHSAGLLGRCGRRVACHQPDPARVLV